MGRRRNERHEWADEPDRLLFHERAHDVWAKLDWEANEFRSRIGATPIVQPVVWKWAWGVITHPGDPT